MNHNHDNLLEIRERGETRYISRGDYGDTSTAIVRGIDPEAITREGMAANSAMVANLLKQFAPTIDAPDNRHPQVTGLSSPAELASRNERFKWTTVAVIVLSSITAAGIVLVAQRVVEIDAFEAVAGWLVLSGLGGYASATWVSHQESRLTPESIERERVAGDYDIAATDAESRQMIARAFSESIVNESRTKVANAEAQRAANVSLLERSKPITAPQRAPVSYGAYSDDYADETPQQAPERRYVVEWESAQESELIVAPTIAPDKDLVAMLSHVDQIYAHCEEHNSDIITLKLQWGDRGDFSPDAKEKAKRVLAYFADNYDAPLIYRGNENGGRYRLNRQAWKRQVARLIIAREWGN